MTDTDAALVREACELYDANMGEWGDSVEACDRILSRLSEAERKCEATVTPALRSVLDERTRQDAKWGVQNHESVAWLAILMEEVGELSQAVLEAEVFDNGRRDEFTLASVREEAVQSAAVALALVECIDRAALAALDKEETS